MSKQVTDHWSLEQKAAFDNWLAISIEIIEKYSFSQLDKATEDINLEADPIPLEKVLLSAE